jgi:hypothetical protein
MSNDDIIKEFDNVYTLFKRMTDRFEVVNAKLSELNTKLNTIQFDMDKQFDVIFNQLDRLKAQVSDLKHR